MFRWRVSLPFFLMNTACMFDREMSVCSAAHLAALSMTSVKFSCESWVCVGRKSLIPAVRHCRMKTHYPGNQILSQSNFQRKGDLFILLFLLSSTLNWGSFLNFITATWDSQAFVKTNVITTVTDTLLWMVEYDIRKVITGVLKWNTTMRKKCISFQIWKDMC